MLKLTLSAVALLLAAEAATPRGLFQPPLEYVDPAFLKPPRHHGKDRMSGGTEPKAFAPLQLSGVVTVMASFYGAKGERGLNKYTANGSVFNPHAMTAAHRTLPFGTRLKVAFAGREVIVRVNDRGPAAWTGRSLDLSYGAALKLGLVPRGTGKVEIVVLN